MTTPVPVTQPKRERNRKPRKGWVCARTDCGFFNRVGSDGASSDVCLGCDAARENGPRPAKGVGPRAPSVQEQIDARVAERESLRIQVERKPKDTNPFNSPGTRHRWSEHSSYIHEEGGSYRQKKHCIECGLLRIEMARGLGPSHEYRLPNGEHAGYAAGPCSGADVFRPPRGVPPSQAELDSHASRRTADPASLAAAASARQTVDAIAELMELKALADEYTANPTPKNHLKWIAAQERWESAEKRERKRRRLETKGSSTAKVPTPVRSEKTSPPVKLVKHQWKGPAADNLHRYECYVCGLVRTRRPRAQIGTLTVPHREGVFEYTLPSGRLHGYSPGKCRGKKRKT